MALTKSSLYSGRNILQRIKSNAASGGGTMNPNAGPAYKVTNMNIKDSNYYKFVNGTDIGMQLETQRKEILRIYNSKLIPKERELIDMLSKFFNKQEELNEENK